MKIVNMKTWFLVTLTLLFISMVPATVSAGNFDGSKPLLCAIIKVVECTAYGDADEVVPENMGMPRFVTIDFNEKIIRPTKESGIKRKSKIERVEHLDGKLILQGAEEGVEGVRDGLGWSIAISEETGKMVLTASGDQVGFVVFGACTPQ
jgi:hypothetical protein